MRSVYAQTEHSLGFRELNAIVDAAHFVGIIRLQCDDSCALTGCSRHERCQIVFSALRLGQILQMCPKPRRTKAVLSGVDLRRALSRVRAVGRFDKAEDAASEVALDDAV